ncbi:hypothetical protein CJU89_5788 [Yarrowia sp. B02]|nr:hypothetical protein CJU89_5788 [Yarrowia sp. B02]
MELFVQRVLGSVTLNEHVDEMGEYLHSFSGWVARQRKLWAAQKVVPAAIYNSRHKDKKTEPLLKTQNGIVLSDNMLPWAVFGCHVILNYSTDVLEVVNWLQQAGFELPSVEVVEEILAWSSYPVRLGMSRDEKDFASNVYSLLGSSEPGFFPYCKSGYIKQTWKALYEHHFQLDKFNALKGEAGVVFFGLFRIEKNVYSVFYMDAMTEAVEFSNLITTYRDFSDPKEFDRMSQDVCACLCAFLKKHGYPKFMVLINPLSNWLYYVLSRAIKNVWIPCDTQFVAPQQKSDTEFLVCKNVEPFLSVIAFFLDNRDIQTTPPFKYFKSPDSSWRLTFATNIHWAQNQIFPKFPRTLSDELSKRLLVREIPSLEYMEADPVTFRLLKTKSPKRFRGPEAPVIRQELKNAAEFDDLIRKAERFTLSLGHQYAKIIVDTLSKKMLVYLFQVNDVLKKGESLDLTKSMDSLEAAFASLEPCWEYKGVELQKAGNFGPAEPFEGDSSERSDGMLRQFHLSRERQHVKREFKQESPVESDEEVVVDDVVDVDSMMDVDGVVDVRQDLVKEEKKDGGEEEEDGVEKAEDGDDVGDVEKDGEEKKEDEENHQEHKLKTPPSVETSPKRRHRRAAEVAAAKVTNSYQRYIQTSSGDYIDVQVPDEIVKIKCTPRSSRRVQPSPKKRKIDFGKHFEDLQKLGQLGKEMSAQEEEEGEEEEEEEEGEEEMEKKKEVAKEKDVFDPSDAVKHVPINGKSPGTVSKAPATPTKAPTKQRETALVGLTLVLQEPVSPPFEAASPIIVPEPASPFGESPEPEAVRETASEAVPEPETVSEAVPEPKTVPEAVPEPEAVPQADPEQDVDSQSSTSSVIREPTPFEQDVMDEQEDTIEPSSPFGAGVLNAEPSSPPFEAAASLLVPDDEPPSPLFEAASRTIVPTEPSSPPFEAAAGITIPDDAEPSSPPFEAAGSIIVPDDEPSSPQAADNITYPNDDIIVQYERYLTQSDSLPTVHAPIIYREPMSPPFVPAPQILVREEEEPPFEEMNSPRSPSPDQETLAEKFSHVDISQGFRVLQTTIEDDLRSVPEARYLFKRLQYAGTQYPDGSVVYSSDSESNYLDADFSDMFGPERRNKVVEHTEADFQFAGEDEWGPLQEGDLQKIYDILKQRCDM